jgi:uncharacterized protein
VKLKHKLERLTMVSPMTRLPTPEASVAEPTMAAPCDAATAAPVVFSAATASDAALSTEIDARRDRIARLRAQLENLRSARAPAPPRTPPSAWCDDEEVTRTHRKREPVDATLPGERIDTDHGALSRVVTLHEVDHRHGGAPVHPACAVLASEVALLSLDAVMHEVDFGRALYLDTETTGLAGGAGTLPFLIGMAWFDDECLRVEQLLLPGPGHERPMLARLAERLREASVIVSFNGKSFDWPLLRTRFILNRFSAPTLPAHLDLLHCARRVYKPRLGSVRLVHLEQALLGFERIDDIPGELIPEKYFAYVRGHAGGSSLQPIVDHNRSDLVALPALLAEIVRRFAGDHASQDARDQLGFARVAARGAKCASMMGTARARAIALAHGAALADVRGELAPSALYLVGELKLREGDLTGALEAFACSLEASVAASDLARAHLALAKLHEHKTKRYALARDHALHTSACEGEPASARRVARLTQRLLRKSASSG